MRTKLLAILVLTSFFVGCGDPQGLDLREPALGDLPEFFDFGPVFVGGRAERQFTISNVGKGLLRLESPQIDNSVFSINDIGEVVSPNVDLVVSVFFEPTEPGEAQGNLQITTNTASNAIALAFTGVGLEPLDCEDENPCTTDTFDPNIGTCGYVPSEGSCEDGSACTDNDRCVDGSCVGRAIVCDDRIECTRDLCDMSVGCVVVGDDSKCVDADPCTLDKCSDEGCENPPAPDGHICGDVVACATAEICVFRQCIEVAIPDGAPCDDADECTVSDQCADQVCEGTGISRPPATLARTTMVEGTTSGSLVGDHLYVSTPVAGLERFKVMRFDAQVTAPTRAIPALNGNANFKAVGQDRWARVSTSSAGIRWVDVIDTTNPALPVQVAKVFGGYALEDYRTSTSVDTTLFYCASFAPGAPLQLTSIDLRDPAAGPAPAHSEDRPCQDPEMTFARGDMWVAWDPTTQSAGIRAYRLFPGDVSSIINHGFATDGASNYGPVERVVTDGHRVIADLGHPSYFFVFDLDESPPTLHRISLPARLLLMGVWNYTAYFGARGDIVAYDLSAPDAPVLLSRSVSLGSSLVPSDTVVALDDRRLILSTSEGRLRVLSISASGLSDSFTVRGTGSFGRLMADQAGLLAVHRGGVTFVDPSQLPVTTLRSTPTSVRFALEAPHIIDGPDGPAGVFSPLLNPITDGCPAPLWGCDRTQLVPLDDRLGRVSIASNGSATATISGPAMGNATKLLIDGQGCIGAGFAGPMLAARYVVYDRCVAPRRVELIAEIPSGMPGGSDLGFLRTKDHGNGFATFLGRSFAVLFDYRQPLAPVIAGELFLSPMALAGFLGADFDGTHWVLTGRNEQGQSWLRVLDVGATVTELSQVTFDAAVGTPKRNILALQWPLLYVGADQDGESLLLVYDLEAPTPEVVYSMPLDSPAIDIVQGADELYVARADGLTVVATACRSSE